MRSCIVGGKENKKLAKQVHVEVYERSARFYVDKWCQIYCQPCSNSLTETNPAAAVPGSGPRVHRAMRPWLAQSLPVTAGLFPYPPLLSHSITFPFLCPSLLWHSHPFLPLSCSSTVAQRQFRFHQGSLTQSVQSVKVTTCRSCLYAHATRLPTLIKVMEIHT